MAVCVLPKPNGLPSPKPEREPRGGRRARGARGMREIGTDPAPEEKTENLYFFFSHTLVFLLYTPKAVKKATANTPVGKAV